MSGLNQALASLSRLVLRLLLAAAATLFVLSLLAAVAVLAAIWSLRAVWARLRGRPVTPFVRRFDLGAGFGQVMRRGADRGPVREDEIIDVQARDLPGPAQEGRSGGALPPQ